jgi:hypothetical protein
MIDMDVACRAPIRAGEIPQCRSMIAVVDALRAETLFQKINDSGHMIFADVQGIPGKSIAWVGSKVKAGTRWPN